MKPSNDNRSAEELRERELQDLALKIASERPLLAPFDHEWEALKPTSLTPEELARVRVYAREMDRIMSETLDEP